MFLVMYIGAVILEIDVALDLTRSTIELSDHQFELRNTSLTLSKTESLQANLLAQRLFRFGLPELCHFQHNAGMHPFSLILYLSEG